MSGRAKLLLGLIILLLAAGGIVVVTRPVSPSERLRPLMEELRALRDSAQACSAALATEQARFVQHEARVDSLRQHIEGFERLAPRGVPADSYPKYLAAVDSFNAAARAWQPIADSLAARRRACEARVEAHRVFADSVRAFADSLGLPAAAGSANEMDNDARSLRR